MAVDIEPGASCCAVFREGMARPFFFNFFFFFFKWWESAVFRFARAPLMRSIARFPIGATAIVPLQSRFKPQKRKTGLV